MDENLIRNCYLMIIRTILLGSYYILLGLQIQIVIVVLERITRYSRGRFILLIFNISVGACVVHLLNSRNNEGLILAMLNKVALCKCNR